MSLLESVSLVRRRVFLVACLGAALLFLTARHYWPKPKPRRPVSPFHFPFQELAALDRDLQARFAVVPDKDFGIMRTYGNQHYLYNPQSKRELETISALKKKKTDVAFYLMSRALWLRSWDGWGFKPIQGPVHLTGKITSPLPRIVNFAPSLNAQKDVVDQVNAIGSDGPKEGVGLPTHNPEGTPVASPTPPPGVPSVNELQKIGDRVFEMAEYAPTDAHVGISQPINDEWKVVAVPIRASNEECLSCHTYHQSSAKPKGDGRMSVEVGDALGVAFYLYNIAEKQSAPQLVRQKPSLHRR